MSFHFTPEQIAFFQSKEYSTLYTALKHEIEKYTDPLRLQTTLRNRFPDIPREFIQATLEQFYLQPLIKKKTGLDGNLLTTKDLLEQASSEKTSQFHASLLQGQRHVLELCSGMGTDTYAIANVCNQITTVEADGSTAMMLEHNLRELGVQNVNVVHSLVEEFLATTDILQYSAFYIDPARRYNGKRTLNPDEYLPPLSKILPLTEKKPVVVKTAPATSFDYNCSKIFVAVGRECKEQLLLFGFRRPSIQVTHADFGFSWNPYPGTMPVINQWNYLVEPHNAVIISGNVENYLHSIGSIPIDPSIAYGVAEQKPISSPLHSTFKILTWFSYSEKKLQDAITTLEFDKRTEIKKRGFPLLPDEVRKKLHFENSGMKGVVILTRAENKHISFLCLRDTKLM